MANTERFFKRQVGVLSVIAMGAVFIVSNVFADETPSVAFSDPSVVVPMSEEWIRQGIEHAPGQQVDLVVTLDQQLYPILLPMIQEFTAREKIKIAVEEGTCGISAGALARKSVDIGGFCCPPGEIDRLPGLRFHTIAIGSIALIANPLNKTENLSLNKARELLGGQISHWGELPTSGFRKNISSPVQAISRQHCKTRPGHWKLIIEDGADFSPTVLDVSAITDMINVVAKYPFSIGYETLWHIKRHAESAKVNVLSVGGVHPNDLDAVAAGRYPFYRVFNVTTWEGAEVQSPMADKLVAYLLANSGRISPMTGMIPAEVLRNNGWKFIDNELIGGPN